MADEDTPFDVPDVEDLDDVQLGEAEGDLGTAEIVTLVLRSLTLVLSMVGGLVLVMMIMRRRRGSWLEALTVVTIHILWQVNLCTKEKNILICIDCWKGFFYYFKSSEGNQQRINLHRVGNFQNWHLLSYLPFLCKTLSVIS